MVADYARVVRRSAAVASVAAVVMVALGAGLLYALRCPRIQLGVRGVAAAGGTLHALQKI